MLFVWYNESGEGVPEIVVFIPWIACVRSQALEQLPRGFAYVIRLVISIKDVHSRLRKQSLYLQVKVLPEFDVQDPPWPHLDIVCGDQSFVTWHMIPPNS